MAITTAAIKELREITGAGMMECKNILTETGGDIEAAIDALRKKGAANAEKKAGRIAADGLVVSMKNDRSGVILEINCETDFVSKDESFKNFCEGVGNVILDNDVDSVEALASAPMDGATVEEARQALISKIGENINIRRFEKIAVDSATVASYLHGARIGVMVKTSGSEELGRDIAMHIAASRPICISEDDVAPEVLEKEKEIFIAQAAESGKPPEIIEKMVGGRIKKFLKENTLHGQPFVKNPDQTVGQLLSDAGATVEAMYRFEVGEGIQKREEDFVAEVMAQAKA